MMGIPLMSGFASKWMLYAAALQAGWAVPAMVAWAASLGTVFFGAKATSAVFLGPLTKATKDAHESPPTMVWGMGFLAAGSVILGIAPQLAVNYLLNPILLALKLDAVQVTWFGLSVGAGSFSTMGGLVLAVVSLILGGLIYAIAYVSRQPKIDGAALAGGGIFTGGEPLSEQGRLTAGDFSSIFLQNWHEFFRWSNVDAVYLGVWRGMQAVSRWLGVIVSWMERHALALVVVLAACVLMGIRWFAHGIILSITRVPLAPQAQAPTLLVVACAVAAVALVMVALSHTTSRNLAPLMILAGVATVAGLAVADPWTWIRLGLLELGAFVTVLLVWQSGRTRATKLTYLTVVVLSALCLVAGDLLLERGQREWAWALILTSVCVKLAAVPLFFWLLSLADEVPAVILGLIIAVVDMAAFGEFWISAQSVPGLRAPQGFLLVAAAVTSFLAALLMLTQRSLKRLLVLSTVEDVGFLLLGLGSVSNLGTWGIYFAASTHAIAKALLFICLSGPEADGALDGEHTGLATRYPVAAFGFLFGMLAMLGIPPTIGYIGRWRLYETAVQIGWPLAAIFILSSIFALIAYTLALTRIWWGPPGDAHPHPSTPHITKEPFLLQAVIVALVLMVLAGGFWPDALQMLLGGRP
jgi:formate hydrogenlyase subunit 3/multisubunit Na+/H+ antiporter MnhD subunit